MRIRVKIESAHSREPLAGRRRQAQYQTRMVAQTMAHSRPKSIEARDPGQGVRPRAGKGRKRPSCRYSRTDRSRRGRRQSLPSRCRRASSRRVSGRPSAAPEVQRLLVTKPASAAKGKRGRRSRVRMPMAMAPTEVQARTDSRTPSRRARREVAQRVRVRSDAGQTRTPRRKEAADGSAQSAGCCGGGAAGAPPLVTTSERRVHLNQYEGWVRESQGKSKGGKMAYSLPARHCSEVLRTRRTRWKLYLMRRCLR